MLRPAHRNGIHAWRRPLRGRIYARRRVSSVQRIRRISRTITSLRSRRWLLNLLLLLVWLLLLRRHRTNEWSWWRRDSRIWVGRIRHDAVALAVGAGWKKVREGRK